MTNQPESCRNTNTIMTHTNDAYTLLYIVRLYTTSAVSSICNCMENLWGTCLRLACTDIWIAACMWGGPTSPKPALYMLFPYFPCLNFPPFLIYPPLPTHTLDIEYATQEWEWDWIESVYIHCTCIYIHEPLIFLWTHNSLLFLLIITECEYPAARRNMKYWNTHTVVHSANTYVHNY